MSDITVDIPSGTYVVAVSGGVDSMVLLDILSRNPDLHLVVAHFDHGIRAESEADRKLVQSAAKRYNLPFVFDKVNLGPGASEAEARKARYKFLKSVKAATGANAIITAHHQDDLIETAIINMSRGTNRKGLSSLKSRKGMIRPITHIDKSTLYNYANDSGIIWNEDSTNNDTNYKRNYIRHNVVSQLNPEQRQQLVTMINNISALNNEIDQEVRVFLDEYSSGTELNRYAFISLPHAVAIEIMASWLRQNKISDFDKKLLELLTITAKTLYPGQRVDINVAYYLQINKTNLALIDREC